MVVVFSLHSDSVTTNRQLYTSSLVFWRFFLRSVLDQHYVIVLRVRACCAIIKFKISLFIDTNLLINYY